MNSHRISHTHLQSTQADTQTENCKRVCLANALNNRQNEEKPVCNTLASILRKTLPGNRIKKP